MTKREIKKAIRLSGQWNDFTVHHDLPGQAIICHVPTAAIGHAIVRALRDLAEQSQNKPPRIMKPTAHELAHLNGGT